MVFPFATGFALARPREPIPMIAFERPCQPNAMRLPAPGPISKLSRESDIRRTAGRACVRRACLPPCNFAAVSPDFPRHALASRNRDTRQHPTRSRRQKGAGRTFAAPSLSEIVTKLSHRIGAGNLARCFCICYIGVEA